MGRGEVMSAAERAGQEGRLEPLERLDLLDNGVGQALNPILLNCWASPHGFPIPFAQLIHVEPGDCAAESLFHVAMAPKVPPPGTPGTSPAAGVSAKPGRRPPPGAREYLGGTRCGGATDGKASTTGGGV